MSAGSATARACSGCSTPSPGCRAGLRPELVLAGEGPLEGALRRRAAALGIAGRVRFAGFLDRDGVRAELQRRRLLRQPRRLRDGPADAARGHGLRHARW